MKTGDTLRRDARHRGRATAPGGDSAAAAAEPAHDVPSVTEPWAKPAGRTVDALEVDPKNGLDENEARRRLKRYGLNRLQRARRRSAWRILIEQLENPMIVLLAAAAVLAFLFVDWVEGVAIVAVILINAAIGFVTELRAVRSMEALYRLEQLTARVRRGGEVREIPAQQLVPGDIALVEAGDLITADIRLVQGSKLQANESALTGESVPVGKSVEPVAADAPLAERACMLYKGTAATRGSGLGVVIATGTATELGRISELLEETEAGTTPLERRLERLAGRMIWVTLGLAAVVAVSGIAAGRDIFVMLETAVALAVAAVPEGLPVVATIALARGMWRMARQNALINRLAAVETLGATGVICTDKTGTLTENRMTVTRLALPSGEIEVHGGERDRAFARNGAAPDPKDDARLREILEIGVLCNNAELSSQDPDAGVGDPMEVALLAAGAKAGLSRRRLLEAQPEEREEAFDPDIKMMATFHRRDGALRVAVKGAPEAVIPVCTRIRADGGEAPFGDAARRRWSGRNKALAADGLRLLALASKEVGAADAEPYRDLVFLGLVGLVDPPRNDVRPALDQCRSAGIRVVMVTGDQAATAGHVARAVGLVDDDAGGTEALPGRAIKPGEALGDEERRRLLRAPIFARVSPEQKLNLISLYQDKGAIVAMTGDGVNDAPALKKADIGVAMGQRGTQVAREAADMVLKDDAFRTIVIAVQQGRIIFDNIRKFALYLLSCNVSEVLVVTLAMLANAPLPLLPLQILFLNLVTDVFPALALGVGPGDPRIMERDPRPPREPILTRRHWTAVAAYGGLITAATLGAFAVALRAFEMETTAAITVSFLTLAFAQLWHVFNMRSPGSRLLWNDIARNAYVWGALLVCVALLAAAVYVPPLARVLAVIVPDARSWAVILLFSLVPLVIGQTYLQIRPPYRRHAEEQAGLEGVRT